MTHKELLAKLNPEDWQEGYPAKHFIRTLRAVVELHKVADVGLFCDGCARFVEPYPCPTIQAIEKELR